MYYQHINDLIGRNAEVDIGDHDPNNGDYGKIVAVKKAQDGDDLATLEFADGTQQEFRVGDLAISF